MADILISHANEDHARIQELVNLLSAHNWSIWWNQNIPPGEAIDMATEIELERACVVITVWSKSSVHSRLIRNTAFEAIESHRWIPLVFDSVQLPLRYRDYQSIEMVDWPDQEHAVAERSLFESCQGLLRADAFLGSTQETFVGVENQTLEPISNANRTKSEISLQHIQFATIQLGEWTIEEGQNRMHRGAQVKKVTPRSMQVLMYLINNSRIPMSIERILSHVWRDRVVVESVVHRCISELREALEDDFKNPAYIETIAKRGYRIVAPTSKIG